MNSKPIMLRKYLIATVLGFVFASTISPAALAQSESLTQAYKIISSKRFVDLTHSFSPLTPVWKGFGQATFSRAADPKTGRPYTVEKDGFQTFFYSMVGQYGTHVDPPGHFDPNGRTVDQIPLKQMIVPPVVFDTTPMLTKDPNHALTVADIQDWERRYGRVPAGCFVAVRTDMYKDWDTNRSVLDASLSRRGLSRRSSSCTKSVASWPMVTSRWTRIPPKI
jgi:kynurenine formamidase